MKYTLENIVGYAREKEELKELCEIFNSRDKFAQMGAKLPKGIIFYGPSGTGKTLFAKVIASICDFNMQVINVGESTSELSVLKQIKKAFDNAGKRKKPTMIFFDEIDKVLPNEEERYVTDRSKTLLAQLLTLIDGMNSCENIVFVATCNYYDALPEVLVRPGRIDKKLYLGNPDYISRVELLKMYMGKTTCFFDVNIEELARKTSGLSCAAIETLINECVLHSNGKRTISEADVSYRLSEIKQENIPTKNSQYTDYIFAVCNLGHFVCAKQFDSGNYVLNLENDNLCNNFFNTISLDVSDDYDDDYDDYDDYDDDDDYDDERKKKSDEQTPFFGYEDFLNAIVVNYGGFVAQKLIINRIFDNNKNNFVKIEYVFKCMLEHGMLGIENIYFPERNREFIRYENEKMERINKIIEDLSVKCCKKAEEIVLKNIDLIKKLVPILMEKETIYEEEGEKILKELGGINYVDKL